MIQQFIKFFTSIIPIKSTDDAIGFFAGSAFTTLFVSAMDWHLLFVLLGRGVGALIIGIIGGWAGLMGKDLYKYVSCRSIYNFFKHKRKKRKP